jgi:L-amino acid N-acyltransferase YncA
MGQESQRPAFTEPAMPSDLQIRAAGPADASSIAAIYAPHVLHGTVSFEVEPPSAEEILCRRAAVLEAGLPYLVAEIGGAIAGYAYASRFRPRPAYRFTVENSVYVSEQYQRRGIARLLMQELIQQCMQSGIREMIAVIATPATSTASVALHRSLGFREAGVLLGVGEKFGEPLDVLMMQKSLR